MPVLGIDVSHNNGEIDWDAVARSNVGFVYCKAAEGASITDPMFHENWEAIGRTTLLRGVYHFAQPSTSSAERQAEHFAETVGVDWPRMLPPALDLERDGGLSPEVVLDWARAFVSRAEALFKRELMIYTGGLWRRTLGDPVVPEFGTRMLWTARYGDQQPVVPRTWSRWDIWQFTDGVDGDVQSIPGVRGPVDCDRFRGELAELQALALPAPLAT